LLGGKQVELIRELASSAVKVAMLVNPSNAGTRTTSRTQRKPAAVWIAASMSPR
jgi:hypothetical protein